MVRIRIAVVFLALLGIVGAAERLTTSTLAFTSDQHIVVALYKANYTWDTWDNTYADAPASPYVSSDILTITRHVTEAKMAGIDAFIVAWYGSKAEFPSHANSLALLEQADKSDFYIAVLLELNAPTLDSADEVTEALLVLTESHLQAPAYLRSGKHPVIFFRGQDRLSLPSWQAIRNRVDPENNMLWIADDNDLAYLEVFDGVFGVKTALKDEPELQYKTVSNEILNWREIRGTHLLWVAVVMPGYAEVRNGGQGITRIRSQGTFYAAQWQAARTSSADWVFINSYNDWKLATQIEPSPQYMEAYLTITAMQGNLFRSLNAEDPPLQDTSDILPTEEVSPQPTTTELVNVEETAYITESEDVTSTLSLPTRPIGTPQATPIRLFTPNPNASSPPATMISPEPTTPGETENSLVLSPTPAILRRPVESMPSQKRCFPLPLLLPVIVMGVDSWTKRQK